jgi:ureidoacrylate peracid hydrolase
MRFHTEPLTTLEAKVRPAHTAMLVVDMQNEFCCEGGMVAAEGCDVTPVQEMALTLRPLLETARAAGVLVVFTQNITSTNDNWYLSEVWLEQAARRRKGSYSERWPCAPGSWGADYYEDVRPLPTEPVVVKHRFDAFLNTDLETILRAHGTRTIVLTGVATDICVETTARSAFMRDYYVVIAGDSTATYAEETQRETLRRLDHFFGQVVSTRELSTLREPAVIRAVAAT